MQRLDDNEIKELIEKFKNDKYSSNTLIEELDKALNSDTLLEFDQQMQPIICKITCLQYKLNLLSKYVHMLNDTEEQNAL